MKDTKRAPMKGRKDVGEVVFPIEKLMAAREASFSCIHLEAALESGPDLAGPINDRSHMAVTGKESDPK